MCICVSHLQDAQEILSVNILPEAEWDLSKKWLFSKRVCSSPSWLEVGRSWEPQPLPPRHSSVNAPGGEKTTATLSPFLAGASVLIHSGASGGRAAFGSPHCNWGPATGKEDPDAWHTSKLTYSISCFCMA